MALPTIVCLRSVYNDKYLRYQTSEDRAHGLLRFSGETVLDPYAQFQVEKSPKWDGLVHLKSRYTNKYLVRWSPNHYWITASAFEPNEDQTKWNCTLFRAFEVEGEPGHVQLVHVQLGNYVRLYNFSDAVSPEFQTCLFAYQDKADGSENSPDKFAVTDWESVLKMPRRVAFKGDNGKYLGASPLHDGRPGLQFSLDDPNDPKAAHEVISSPDGTVGVKSDHYGMFWRLGDGDHSWVVADAADPRETNEAKAMFRPAWFDTSSVFLLNMQNTLFVKRYTSQKNESYLAANSGSAPDKFCRLEFVELEK